MEQSDKDLNDRQKAFQDIDVSNFWELGSTIFLCMIGNYLIFRILFKIQNLFLWQQDNRKNNPNKMLKVNILLLIVLFFKILSYYYGIAGFIFSKMWLWNCEDDNKITISPNIYVTIQISEAQFLNITFCYCCNLWLQLLGMKLEMEQKKFQLKLTKYLQKFLILFIFLILIMTIISIILLFLNKPNYERYVLGGATLISAFIFITTCCYLNYQLTEQYDLGDSYRRNLKSLIIVLVLCALVRPAFNFVLDQDFILLIKSGTECIKDADFQLPDENWYWALTFIFIYSMLTDLIPVFILSILFSPQYKKEKLMNKVNTTWDAD